MSVFGSAEEKTVGGPKVADSRCPPSLLAGLTGQERNEERVRSFRDKANIIPTEMVLSRKSAAQYTEGQMEAGCWSGNRPRTQPNSTVAVASSNCVFTILWSHNVLWSATVGESVIPTV